MAVSSPASGSRAGGTRARPSSRYRVHLVETDAVTVPAVDAAKPPGGHLCDQIGLTLQQRAPGVVVSIIVQRADARLCRLCSCPPVALVSLRISTAARHCLRLYPRPLSRWSALPLRANQGGLGHVLVVELARRSGSHGRPCPARHAAHAGHHGWLLAFGSVPAHLDAAHLVVPLLVYRQVVEPCQRLVGALPSLGRQCCSRHADAAAHRVRGDAVGVPDLLVPVAFSLVRRSLTRLLDARHRLGP